MKVLKTMIIAVLLVAGLCGCEKLVQEINLDNLEGSWQKEYAKDVQDALRRFLPSFLYSFLPSFLYSI